MLFLQQLGERLALGIFHNDVAGFMGSEEAGNLDDVSMIKLGQGSGFIQKALQPPFKVFLVGRRLWKNGRSILADRQIVG